MFYKVCFIIKNEKKFLFASQSNYLNEHVNSAFQSVAAKLLTWNMKLGINKIEIGKINNLSFCLLYFLDILLKLLSYVTKTILVLQPFFPLAGESYVYVEINVSMFFGTSKTFKPLFPYSVSE